MKVFSVFDSKAAIYLPPFIQRNELVARRLVLQVMNDSSHDFAQFPGDYTLFELGTWDDETGKLKNHEAATNLGTLLQIAAAARMAGESDG